MPKKRRTPNSPEEFFKAAGDRAPFSGDDILDMVCNPVYAGMGPFPAIVTDDQWVAAVARVIESHGVETVLQRVVRNLNNAFGREDLVPDPQTWAESTAELFREHGAETMLRGMLIVLRKAWTLPKQGR